MRIPVVALEHAGDLPKQDATARLPGPEQYAWLSHDMFLDGHGIGIFDTGESHAIRRTISRVTILQNGR